MNVKHVLVMDDERDMLEVCKTLLESQGFAVHTAFNALGGLEILSRRKIDLILADLKMPGMEGLEFMEKARAQNPQIGFILMTGFWSNKTYEIEKASPRLDGFLKKPFSPEALFELINNFFARERVGD